MAVVLDPIIAEARVAQKLQRDRSKVGNGFVGQQKEAGIVDDQR